MLGGVLRNTTVVTIFAFVSDYIIVHTLRLDITISAVCMCVVELGRSGRIIPGCTHACKLELDGEELSACGLDITISVVCIRVVELGWLYITSLNEYRLDLNGRSEDNLEFDGNSY